MRDHGTKGKIIVLEGLDGAGTTTMAKRLYEDLVAAGIETHLTRQPSDLDVGVHIRKLLLDNKRVPWHEMALLFAADRLHHWREKVEPFLEDGGIVVSDRWYQSSLVYQPYDARSRAWVYEINKYAYYADLVIWLRCDPVIAMHRRMAAGRPVEMFDDLKTQKRIAENYALVMGDTEGVVEIDAEASVEAVYAQVKGAAWKVLG